MTLKEQALSLYKEVFSEDTEEFAEKFTNRYFDKCCRYKTENGKIVSMLYLLDCAVFDGEKTSAAKYLYAAATHLDFRGKGIMAKLINEALLEQEIIVTKPANKSLFSYYEKFGFKVCSFKDEIKESFKSEEKISLNQYVALRKKLLKNTPHILLLDDEFTLDGFTLYGNDNYCAAVDRDTGEVKEYINEKNREDKTPFAMATVQNNFYFGIAMD